MNTVVPVGARGNSSPIAVLGNKVGAREQPLPRCLKPAKPWEKAIRLDDSHFSLQTQRLPINLIGKHIFHTPGACLGLVS